MPGNLLRPGDIRINILKKMMSGYNIQSHNSLHNILNYAITNIVSIKTGQKRVWLCLREVNFELELRTSKNLSNA